MNADDAISPDLEQLFKLYEAYMAAKRYLQAEQVCLRALNLCGYQSWAWAYFLAETYYPRGMHAEAEPYYLFAARELANKPLVHPTLPRCLMFLAYTEAFLGKEELAGEHWRQSMDYFARSKGLASCFARECRVTVRIVDDRIKISFPPEAMSAAWNQFCREHSTEIANLFPGSE